MRPAEFAPESIIEAGQQLQAAGRNITGFALRQKVGGGNPSRLKQVWDEHINTQATTKAEPVAELPIEVAEEVAAVTKALTERLALLAVELNDKAVKAAERRVHEVVRSAGEQRAQAERELSDAAQTVDDLEGQLDAATGKVEVLEAKLADVQATSQAQAVELAQVRERVTLTEQTARTAAIQHTAELARMIAAHQQEAEQLRAELAHQQKANQVATKEASTAREDAAKLRGQVEALQTQSADLLRALSDRQPKADETVKSTKPKSS